MSKPLNIFRAVNILCLAILSFSSVASADTWVPTEEYYDDSSSSELDIYDSQSSSCYTHLDDLDDSDDFYDRDDQDDFDSPEEPISHRNYIRFDAGYSRLLNEVHGSHYGEHFKPTFLGAIGVGHIFNNLLRTDLTASYRNNYTYYHKNSDGWSEHQKINSKVLMLNAYLDIKVVERLSPYVTVGGGFAINKTSDLVGKVPHESSNREYLGETCQNLVWQVGIGARIKVIDRMLINFAYNYIDLGKIRTKGVAYKEQEYVGTTQVTGELSAHEMLLGILFNF